MRRSLFILGIFLLASATAVFPPDAAPEEPQGYLYQWTDSKGVVHITDGLGKVPEQYRHGARRLEAAPEEGAEPNQPREHGVSSPAEGEDRHEGEQKALWQRRVRAAKERLAAAERKYRELDQKRTGLLAQWGTPAYAPPEARIEAERLAGEMESVQKEIDDARNQVEVVIPEQARKSGVPPGWLRE